MQIRCGAKLRGKPGYCRAWAMTTVRGKRRCRIHGGTSTRNLRINPWGKPQWEARARKQALMRALGLPWYGGAPKRKATLRMADKAIAVANEILEMLPVPRNVPDEQKGSVELLGEGVRNGLLLTRDTVILGRDALAAYHAAPADEKRLDLKLLGTANITALGLIKLGLKAADTGKRNDIISKLFAAMEAEKASTKGETK